MQGITFVTKIALYSRTSDKLARLEKEGKDTPMCSGCSR